jgi:LEA14-like dessication related protein
MKKCFYKYGFGLLMIAVISSCGQIKEPQFRRVENFGVKNVSLQDATVGLDITYFNPNNFGVAVKEADIDLYVDSVYIGKFMQLNQVDVMGTSEFSIPIEGIISWKKIAQSGLYKKAGREVLVKANGKVKVGKAGVFVNKDIEYSGKNKLDLDILKNPAGGAGF